jgi:hypothetical protein
MDNRRRPKPTMSNSDRRSTLNLTVNVPKNQTGAIRQIIHSYG